eukprot:15459203-Alexandrium_andersonii.AAC.1
MDGHAKDRKGCNPSANHTATSWQLTQVDADPQNLEPQLRLHASRMPQLAQCVHRPIRNSIIIRAAIGYAVLVSERLHLRSLRG